MATNKEKLYKHIQQLFLQDHKNDEDNGINTEEAANFLSIKRSNASALLNKLVREGLLSKTTTRPVRYHLSEKVTHDAFDKLIGKNGSLSKAVEQAKAAIRFPSGMLPVQIIAQHGSGTSYFSKVIVQYAKDKGIIPKKANSYEINCIIGKDEPDKLNQELFGKEGQTNFIDRNKNSVVIINHYEELDETQVYRINRLIDQHQDFNNNLIIFSTTPQNKHVIKTSIQIELPSFNRRPIAEKLIVVESLFEKQAQSSGKSIYVGTDIVVSLASHKYPYGFKDIEKVITLACAKAYLRSLDDNQSQEYISKSDFPDDFIFNKTLDIEQSLEIAQLVKNRENFIFSGKKSNYLTDYTKEYNQGLYQNINKKYQKLTGQGLQSHVIQKSVLDRIQYLFNHYGIHAPDRLSHQYQMEHEELSKIVPDRLIEMTRTFINYASQALNYNFDQNIFYGLCLHLNSLINLGNKSESNLNAVDIAQLKRQYPDELALTRKFVSQLEAEFNYRFSEEDTIIILSFLVEPHNKRTYPVVLFAMHGNGAAHYISNVTNTLNHMHNTYAYDMQLDKDLKIVYQELKKLILRINHGAGVIVIYDMGSFKDLFNKIMDETQINIRLINIPITLIGLETARKAMNDTNIDNVYHTILSNWENYNSEQAKNNKPNLIITLCHTGEGGAVQLRDYIYQYSHLGWVVKAMSISDRDALAKKIVNWRKIYNIKEFIGTYDPNLFGIPFISISKVFKNSHDDLDRVLTFAPINSQTAIFDQVYDYYEKELKYTSVDKLKETMPHVMEMLTEQYHLNQDLQLGVFTHIVGILENGIGGKKREDIKLNSEIKKNLTSDFKYIRYALRLLEKKFDFVFNDSDIYTITAIIKQL